MLSRRERYLRTYWTVKDNPGRKFSAIWSSKSARRRRESGMCRCQRFAGWAKTRSFGLSRLESGRVSDCFVRWLLYCVARRFLSNTALLRSQGMEAHGHQGHFCGGWLHAEAAEVRALYPADGTPIQEGSRNAPRTRCHVPASYYRRKEKSAVADVHAAWCHHQGHHHRGEFFCLHQICCSSSNADCVSMRAQVNVSELGLVTQGGKVIWGKYAQVTNNPENDGCINAVLLV
eukprot:Opistho-1_new@108119